MKIFVDLLYEKFHKRRGTPLESRLQEDSEVSLSLDRKSAKILIGVKTVTRKDTYSSQEVSVSNFESAKGSLSVIMRDKDSALTFLLRSERLGGEEEDLEHSEASRLKSFGDAIKAANREVLSLAKAKKVKMMKDDENFDSSNQLQKHYKGASPSAHVTKDKVDIKFLEQQSSSSGLTPMKKKARDTATPQKFRDACSNKDKSGHELVKLTEEQKQVIKLSLNGENIFVTGGGGTGKSTLLDHLIARLRSKMKGVFVTATTGMSACAIGGVTIHQFAGLSQPIDENDCSYEKMFQVAADIKSKKSTVVQRWKDCKVLLIDEISMLGRKVFETLDVVAREVRGSDSPFGGIQVIFVGDFFQLPPVVRSANHGLGAEGYFCFQSPLWKRLITKTHILQNVFRQKELGFVKVLEDVRQGICGPGVNELLKSCLNREVEDPVHLFAHRSETNRMNEAEISRLPGKARTYRATDSCSKSGGGAYLRMLQNSTPAPESLVLKKDAHIILTRNLDLSKGLVNGARGVVRGFTSSDGGLPVVFFESGETTTLTPVKHRIYLGQVEVASRTQLPCCLGWAITIHKAQGMSIDTASLHLKSVFEFGMTYVALSRARSLSKLRLDCQLDIDRVKAHPKVIEFYREVQ
jgi:ATP-dependent exoDNAse (exonuclease V) alpha subunit